MNDDDPIDPKELAEAQALARALAELEGAHEQAESDLGLPTEAPEDALQTALLLRHSRGHGALAQARREAILEQLLPELKPQPMAAITVIGSRPRRHWLAWTGAAAAAALACAAALLLVQTQRGAAPTARTIASNVTPGFADGTHDSAQHGLPTVPATLLAAQAELVRGTSTASHELDNEMRAYRKQLFRTLERSYPQKLSVLELEPRHGRREGDR